MDGQDSDPNVFVIVNKHLGDIDLIKIRIIIV